MPNDGLREALAMLAAHWKNSSYSNRPYYYGRCIEDILTAHPAVPAMEQVGWKNGDEPRAEKRDDGIPTRNDILLQSTGEAAIRRAMATVEGMGGSVALTHAVTLLSQARDAVADHVEGHGDRVTASGDSARLREHEAGSSSKQSAQLSCLTDAGATPAPAAPSEARHECGKPDTRCGFRDIMGRCVKLIGHKDGHQCIPLVAPIERQECGKQFFRKGTMDWHGVCSKDAGHKPPCGP